MIKREHEWRLRLLPLVVLWLSGVYLRLTILVLPPIAPDIMAELLLNQTQVGLLTTIPVLMLSLAALPGAYLIARLGARNALVFALVIATVGSVARIFVPPIPVLFVATAVLGFGIAVMQPAFPALVLRWCPGFTALGSAVYMNGMLLGEFIGGGLTLPVVMPLVGDSWRGVLLFWSLPAIPIAALMLMSARIGIRETSEGETIATPAVPAWKQARVWQLGIVLGAASAGYFGTNAYMATLLANAGSAELLAEYLAVFNGTQVVGSISMLWLASRWVGRAGPIRVSTAGVLLSLAGASVLTGYGLLASLVVLGFSTCIQLILAVGLVPQIVDEREAAPLAAGMFAVGYLLGFVVPLGSGLLADATGNSNLILAPLVLLAAIALVIAMISPHMGRSVKAA